MSDRYTAEQAVNPHTGDTIPVEWWVVDNETGATVAEGLTEVQARDEASSRNQVEVINDW